MAEDGGCCDGRYCARRFWHEYFLTIATYTTMMITKVFELLVIGNKSNVMMMTRIGSLSYFLRMLEPLDLWR